MPLMTAAVMARVAPFAVFILLLALDPLVSSAMTGFGMDGRWSYAIRAALVAAMLAWWWRQYSELSRPGSVPASTWILAMLVGLLVFVVWIMPYPTWAMLGQGAGFDARGANGDIDLPLALVRLAGASLLVPVMEELFWRSFLMRWIDQSDFLSLKPMQVTLRALVMSSALFAVEHTLWLAGLLAGLAYGALYMISRQLWVPVLSHATTNAALGLYVLHSGVWRYW